MVIGLKKMSDTEVMEKDVKTMTYDDLMAAVRILDNERMHLAQDLLPDYEPRKASKFDKQEKAKRAA